MHAQKINSLIYFHHSRCGTLELGLATRSKFGASGGAIIPCDRDSLLDRVLRAESHLLLVYIREFPFQDLFNSGRLFGRETRTAGPKTIKCIGSIETFSTFIPNNVGEEEQGPSSRLPRLS